MAVENDDGITEDGEAMQPDELWSGLSCGDVRLRQRLVDLCQVKRAIDNDKRNKALGAGVRAATVEGFRRIAVVAEDLVLGELPVFIEVVVEGLRVREFLLAALFAAPTVHVIDHQELILRYATTLALAAVLRRLPARGCDVFVLARVV